MNDLEQRQSEHVLYAFIDSGRTEQKIVKVHQKQLDHESGKRVENNRQSQLDETEILDERRRLGSALMGFT